MTAEVIPLFEYVATCPKCNGDSFHILVDRPDGEKTVPILGTACANCDFRLQWAGVEDD